MTIKVYTDGACLNNSKKDAKSGSGIWFGPNNPRNCTIKVSGETQSNQTGKAVAVITALTASLTFCPLEIISDSKYVINSLITHLTQWKDKG